MQVGKEMYAKKLWSFVMILGILVAAAPTQASPQISWTPPENLSDWGTIITTEGARLEMGPDGTLVAFWVNWNAGFTKWALWARVRQPGQEWTKAENLSGWLEPLSNFVATDWAAGVTPDGTAWAMWTAIDSTIIGDNQFVRVAYRSPGGAWQAEPLSTVPASLISSAEMAISPTGDLVVAWIERLKIAPPGSGPCTLHVRRRFAGSHGWEPMERIDDLWGNTEITNVHPLIGPGGLTVVLWEETNTFIFSEKGVMARVFTPPSGSWSGSFSPPISGWKSNLNLGQPVMGPDGSLVAAWTATSSTSNKQANYNATRVVSSGAWSMPTKISSEQSGGLLSAPQLALGHDGTVAAVWVYLSPTASNIVFANARDPGSTWGTEAQIATGQSLNNVVDVGVWPNGDAMVVWETYDSSRPAGADTIMSWSLRPSKSTWGSAGQLGNYIDDIYGIALGLGDNLSATMLWSLIDTSRPAGQQDNVYAASMDPNGTWSTPTPISDWYSLANITRDGLVVGPGGQPVGAAWNVSRSAMPASAVFFSEIVSAPPPTPSGNPPFLPLVIR